MADMTLGRPHAPTRGAAGAAPGARLRGLLGLLRGEPALILALVGVGLVAHGLNMFNNPGQAGIGDEGIYVSQAWAIVREGRLAPTPISTTTRRAAGSCSPSG